MTKEQEFAAAIAWHKNAKRDVAQSKNDVEKVWAELDRILTIYYWDRDEMAAANLEVLRLKEELGR